MYRDLSQWAMVRRRVMDDGISRSQVVRETGISRCTVRKMLLHRCPQPFGPRKNRYPTLGPHINTIDQITSANHSSALELRLSVMEIYRRLQRDEGYAGSYGAIKGPSHI